MTHGDAVVRGARFRKSSYSGSGSGGCVEFADLGRRVAVRDSKNPTGPMLGFSAHGWQAFISQLRTGRI